MQLNKRKQLNFIAIFLQHFEIAYRLQEVHSFPSRRHKKPDLSQMGWSKMLWRQVHGAGGWEVACFLAGLIPVFDSQRTEDQIVKRKR